MRNVPCFRGLEVAQAPWAMAVRPAGARGTVPHAPRGGARRVARVPALPPTRMGREATGGLERAGPSAWAAAGLPGVVVYPRPARDGARATGQVAHTAAVEARALAPGAAGLRPTPRPRPAAPTPERRALVGRRQPRLVLRPAAPHRLAGPSGRLPKAREAPMAWLKARLAPLANALATRRRASPRWRAHDDL